MLLKLNKDYYFEPYKNAKLLFKKSNAATFLKLSSNVEPFF